MVRRVREGGDGGGKDGGQHSMARWDKRLHTNTNEVSNRS